MRQQVSGEGASVGSFRESLYASFVDIVVQSVQETSTDIRMYILVGRTLWPRYIEPLSRQNIGKTLKGIHESLKKTGLSGREAWESKVLSVLGHRILKHIKSTIEHALDPIPTAGSMVKEMAPLAKLLVLAAYVCQHNHPDKDRQLLGIQKSGRRRKKRRENDTAAENLAFGTEKESQLSFPLERLFSVLASIIGLNETLLQNSPLANTQPPIIGGHSLGSTLSEVQEYGFLTLASAADEARLNGRRMVCTLTEALATQIAKSINFPLERYIA